MEEVDIEEIYIKVLIGQGSAGEYSGLSKRWIFQRNRGKARGCVQATTFGNLSHDIEMINLGKTATK